MSRTSLLLLLCLAAFLFWGCRPSPELSPRDIANYATRISFSNFRLSARENMVGQTVYYVAGEVSNGGDRTITLLEVNVSFRDDLSHVVLRERTRVISPGHVPLGPGESRQFRMGFEEIPDTWNRVSPDLEITRLELE